MFGFGKKKISEESVEWTPPDKDAIADTSDELTLCLKCQFAGRCQFREGCRTFKQIRETRAAKIEAIRGFKGKPYDPRKLNVNTIYGLGWKDSLDKYHHAIVRVVHIEGDIATISVHIKDGEYRDSSRELRREFTVQIKMAGEVVDIGKFRADVKAELRKIRWEN